VSACVVVVWLTLALGVPTSKCELVPGVYAQADYPGMLGDPPVRAHVYVARHTLPAAWTADTRTAKAVFVLAHELGHVRRRSADELAADRYARRRYCGVARRVRARQPSLPGCRTLWQLVPDERGWRRP
jgi:hypothetical protein